MFRFLDIILSFLGLVISIPLFLIIFIIGLIDTGYPIFIQTRLGKNKIPFKLIKFRTMKLGTEQVATHLTSFENITNFGKFLRKTKLDELPQLINVFKGDMSFVGPRPNLENQRELIKYRENLGIYDVSPGITGLAQIKKIDMSDPELLAQTDYAMIKNLTLLNYIKYILKTMMGSGMGDRIKTG